MKKILIYIILITILSFSLYYIKQTFFKKIKQNTIKEYDYVSEIVDEKNAIGKTSKGYKIYDVNGVTYIDGYLIVNKTYGLNIDYIPKDTYIGANINKSENCLECINKKAYEAWTEMKADALALGLNLYIASGYRSYAYQMEKYWKSVLKNGLDIAEKYSARPGHSEHQTGLSFDLNTVDESFEATDEGKWVNENAANYGFIIRYPKGKTEETGYAYESWHLRYVGSKLARTLYNNGNWQTLENYFGITSKYKENT